MPSTRIGARSAARLNRVLAPIGQDLRKCSARPAVSNVGHVEMPSCLRARHTHAVTAIAPDAAYAAASASSEPCASYQQAQVANSTPDANRLVTAAVVC